MKVYFKLMKKIKKAILKNSIVFYIDIETIILSFILDNITYKKPYFYAKNMEVM